MPGETLGGMLVTSLGLSLGQDLVGQIGILQPKALAILPQADSAPTTASKEPHGRDAGIR